MGDAIKGRYILGAMLGWGAVVALGARRAGPATVLYDGACPICRAAVERLRRWDTRVALRFLDARDAETLAERFPRLPPDPDLREMRLVFADGSVLGGFDAARALAFLLPRFRASAPLLHMPGAWAAGSLVYRLIAAHRPRPADCSDHSCPRR